MADPADLPEALQAAYGIPASLLDLDTVYNPSGRGDSLRIAYHATRKIRHSESGGAILSRNLYAAFTLAVMYRMPLLFETHQLETGLRKFMQRQIVRCPWVATIVISTHLAELLPKHLSATPKRTIVLHDAAPQGIKPVPVTKKRERLRALAPIAEGSWTQICGYFGHLYTGRGIDIVEAMAAARPDTLFLVYGGTDADVAARRSSRRLANLSFMGHVPHPMARELMCLMDVLLMPYQQTVSIGVAGHDTARWMSPMKMFEYLGAGVPIISSDLPVLREVLRDDENCLLAGPADTTAWIDALDRLRDSPDLAARIGTAAHAEYEQRHTWTRRAEQILAAAKLL
ncbi:MAG: glycosyltransferase family 4 protein [Ferrovibrio sp.]|uniref:glycosyltransferase family 4 protein n=1 Tax=Ferrovibrio sp. TaxID=1917215 RepID=UPI003918E89B